MQILSVFQKRQVAFILLAVIILSSAVYFSSPRLSFAQQFVLEDGNIMKISDSGEPEQLTSDSSVEIIFDQRDGQVLFGKGWGNERDGETERVGGTELWLYDGQSGEPARVVEGYEVTYALLGKPGQIYFTDLNRDLYLVETRGNKGKASDKKLLKRKVILSDVSADATKVIFTKLADDWAPGDYFEATLGARVLNVNSGREINLGGTFEEWGHMFSPDGQKILFSAPNEFGISSFFTMDPDGSRRVQLTNIGQKAFTPSSIPSPSERPVFSPDGLSLLFESDRQVWHLRVNRGFTHVEEAKAVAYGTSPRWTGNRTFSVVAVPGTGGQKINRLDLDGNTVK